MPFDQLKRRDLLTLLGSAAASLPLAARALPVAPVRHVGVLLNGSAGDTGAPSYVTAFQGTLENLGWTVGRRVQIDYGWDAGAAAADKILGLTPDVIVADGRQALEALRHAALTIPVVFMEIDQPVFYGVVESLAHPDGNMTGFTDLDPSVQMKRPNAVGRMTARVQVFGRRDDETDPTLMRPATKKRQGTKSRKVRDWPGSECYGDLMSAPRLIAGGMPRHRLDVCTDGRPGACLGHFSRASQRISGRWAD